MPKSYLVTAVEFSGDQRPVRSGLYLRRMVGSERLIWGYFMDLTKLWGCWDILGNPRGAYRARSTPSCFQRLPWYALPHQIPSGARIERVSGLTFRVTEA